MHTKVALAEVIAQGFSLLIQSPFALFSSVREILFLQSLTSYALFEVRYNNYFTDSKSEYDTLLCVIKKKLLCDCLIEIIC
jgi:hypothetical protein